MVLFGFSGFHVVGFCDTLFWGVSLGFGQSVDLRIRGRGSVVRFLMVDFDFTWTDRYWRVQCGWSFSF